MNLIQRFKKLREIDENDRKLIQWIFATSVLVTASLAHVYAAPFLTYEPEMIAHQCNLTSLNESNQFQGLDPLKITLYHTFDTEAQELLNEAQEKRQAKGHDHKHEQDEHGHEHEQDEHGHEHEHEHENECSDGNHGIHHHHHDHDEPFCCMLWLKMVFMAGFAVSQFSAGMASDIFGIWSTLRFCCQSLIVSGLLASIASKL